MRATELAIRAPTPRDAAGIADVVNTHAVATGRCAGETPEGVERWFELEDLDPVHDMFLAVEGESIVGYADVSAPAAARDVVNVDLRVPPGRERVVERLLEEVERRASELGEAGARIRAPANEGDGELRVVPLGRASTGRARGRQRERHRSARALRECRHARGEPLGHVGASRPSGRRSGALTERH